MKLKLVGGVIEWLERWNCDRHGFGSKPTHVILCILGKDTLPHFSCLMVSASSSKFQFCLY